MQKIILAEDEQFVARSYIRKLQVEGYEVIHVTNGGDVLSKLASEKPDLLILDLMMPIKSGFEVLKEIQDNGTEDVKNIPIIVASNLGQKSDIDTATSLGAVDFIVKSNVSLKEFIEKIRKHLPVESKT